MQSLPCEKKVIANVYPDKNKVHRILKSKQEAQRQAVADNCDFAIIHEDDILNLRDDNFKALHDYMVKNENCGAAVLGRKDRQHVCCGAMIVRRKFLDDPQLFTETRNCGVCYSLDKYFKEQNAGYEQIDSIERIKHFYGRNN